MAGLGCAAVRRKRGGVGFAGFGIFSGLLGSSSGKLRSNHDFGLHPRRLSNHLKLSHLLLKLLHGILHNFNLSLPPLNRLRKSKGFLFLLNIEIFFLRASKLVVLIEESSASESAAKLVRIVILFERPPVLFDVDCKTNYKASHY